MCFIAGAAGVLSHTFLKLVHLKASIYSVSFVEMLTLKIEQRKCCSKILLPLYSTENTCSF